MAAGGRSLAFETYSARFGVGLRVSASLRSNRHGAASVAQFELLPQPPEQENKPLGWPYWPTKLRTSTCQAEGVERQFAVATLAIVGDGGRVIGVRCARVDEQRRPLPGTEFIIQAELVLIAIGFAGPRERGLLEQLPLERDQRTNVKADTDSYRTSNPKVFAAGDMRKGQSLVVWAILEGRQAARAIDLELRGESPLPR